MNLEGMPELKNTRHLEITDGVVYLAFGKYTGEALEDVASTEPDYLEFILTLAIPEYVKAYIQAAIDGAY